MNKPLLLLLSAGCLMSCHKEASIPANNFTWFGTQTGQVYNYVLINANQVLNNSDTNEWHIGVSAAFIDSNNHQVTSVRALRVNDFVIEPDRDSTYNYSYSARKAGQEFFGSRVSINIRGTVDDDTASNFVYVPKQLSSDITRFPDTLSINRGMELHWTPDDENTWGNVTIQLFYYRDLSRKGDSTLPEAIATRSITASDNGNYFLSKNELAPFPKNAYIGITIARGTQTQVILPLSRKRVYYFSSASISTTPVRMID